MHWEEQQTAEAKPGGGIQLGGGGVEGGVGLGALRELGEQLVAEQEEEKEVEQDLLKPIGDDGR